MSQATRSFNEGSLLGDGHDPESPTQSGEKDSPCRPCRVGFRTHLLLKVTARPPGSVGSNLVSLWLLRGQLGPGSLGVCLGADLQRPHCGAPSRYLGTESPPHLEDPPPQERMDWGCHCGPMASSWEPASWWARPWGLSTAPDSSPLATLQSCWCPPGL